MQQTFSIGEIAILRQDPSFTEEELLRYDGEECEIISALDWHAVAPDVNGSDTMYGYEVQLSDGNTLVCAPHELRKRKQPGDDTRWAISKVQQLVDVCQPTRELEELA